MSAEETIKDLKAERDALQAEVERYRKALSAVIAEPVYEMSDVAELIRIAKAALAQAGADAKPAAQNGGATA